MATNIKKYERCPKCGEHTKECWVTGRKLQLQCQEYNWKCNWKSEPYTPIKQKIKTVKYVEVSQFCGWEYEAFDQYGYAFTYSRTYNTEKECKKEAQEEINNFSKDPAFGKCTAVIWPPTVKVKGKTLKSKKYKEV